MAETKSAGSRQLARGIKLIEEGDYYEAKEVFLSMFNRSIAKKDYMTAFGLLEQGAVQLFQKLQISDGAKLTTEMVEKLLSLVQSGVESETPAGKGRLDAAQIHELLGRVTDAFQQALYDLDAQPGDDRLSLAATLLKEHVGLTRQLTSAWSQTPVEWQRYRYQGVGQTLLDCLGTGAFGEASVYLCQGDSPKAYARAIQKYLGTAKGHSAASQQQRVPAKSEHGLVYTRAILLALLEPRQQPELGEPALAAQFCGELLKYLVSTGWQKEPLQTYCKAVVMAIEKRLPSLCQHAMETYLPSLQRDPALVMLATQVYEAYFESNKTQGGLPDLLKGLLGGK